MNARTWGRAGKFFGLLRAELDGGELHMLQLEQQEALVYVWHVRAADGNSLRIQHAASPFMLNRGSSLKMMAEFVAKHWRKAVADYNTQQKGTQNDRPALR